MPNYIGITFASATFKRTFLIDKKTVNFITVLLES